MGINFSISWLPANIFASFKFEGEAQIWGTSSWKAPLLI